MITCADILNEINIRDVEILTLIYEEINNNTNTENNISKKKERSYLYYTKMNLK